MSKNKEVIKGVSNVLKGVEDILETMPDTEGNVALWSAIIEANKIAEEIIRT